MKLHAYLAVALGSALGGMARHWIAEMSVRRFGEAFPWGTLLVNVTGSFLIGVFAALTILEDRADFSPTVRLFLMTGVCGGYTTFSSFSLQTLSLLRAGAVAYALLNVLASVGACLLAVWLGWGIGRAFLR